MGFVTKAENVLTVMEAEAIVFTEHSPECTGKTSLYSDNINRSCLDFECQRLATPDKQDLASFWVVLRQQYTVCNAMTPLRVLRCLCLSSRLTHGADKYSRYRDPSSHSSQQQTSSVIEHRACLFITRLTRRRENCLSITENSRHSRSACFID